MLRNELYPEILRRLARRFEVEETELCRALKPDLHDLRRHYRNASVEVRYSTESRIAAYLLAYYPNSVAMSWWVHTRLRRFYGTNMSAVVLCGGPLPELLGLSAVLNREHSSAHLTVTSADRHASEWRWSVDLTLDLCSRFAPQIEIDAYFETVDLEKAWGEPRTSLQAADVYVIQNCLNEIWHSEGAVQNLRALARCAPQGALFVAIDQANYGGNIDALRSLRDKFLRLGFEIVEDCDQEYEALRPGYVIPACVSNLFFDGVPERDDWGNWLGEYVRRNITVRSLALRKTVAGECESEEDEYPWRR